MAAMAPALTDAPAEAHHIRFKLAAPSSSLSPASAENNGNASNILIHSSGPAKGKAAPEECPLDFSDPVAQASALGKLQPLVASYLYSDVTSVASTKESIKLQGVLIKQSVLKSHRILPTSLLNGGGEFLLRKRQAIELSGGHLKTLMSGNTNGGSQPMAPVNGLAKKLATIPGSGCVVAVNGDKPSAATDSHTQNQPLDSETLDASLSGHIPLKGTLKQKHSSGVSENNDGNNLESTVLQPAALSPFTQDASNSSEPGGQVEADLNTLNQLQGSHIRERTLLNSNRQAEIEGRLRRLRKRLQVVQAKQVERHIQQQLGGFLDTALSRLISTNRKSETTTPTATWRTGRHSNNKDGLGRFLKSGSMPLELERLYLSGTANLHSAESAFDSDVTESSSGGDSDLEEEELSRVDIEQRHVKIWKRAESRYTVERAAIISHWNWLQAHISDLEYRIRQQTDIYRQIRASKVWNVSSCPMVVKKNTSQFGSVELGGVAPNVTEVKSEPVNSTVSNVNCAFLNKCFFSECAEPRPLQPLDSSCVAARARPLVSCRRRRLIQPNSVPNLNGKVRSCVQCSCRVNPSCVMCGGWPTPREDPQFELPTLERLSRLDLGIHPILSFPDDVSVSLRLQQVMKSQWHMKSLERRKPLKKLSLKHKLSSSKEKHKFTNSLMAVSKYSASDVQPIKRRRGESSFDINNIVIPMSVAATTRVEKLQYKEILTPSWRMVDIFSQKITEEEDQREVEDLSDAAFVQLHQPYEDQERSRWSWMALAPAKRRGSRSYKSIDGRTTPLLCGTNPPTPQPASPDPGHCPLLHDYSHVPSPLSPPSPDTTSNPHTPCSRDSHRLLSSEDTRCSTPDFSFEERTVAPWERRSFPLSEDPAPEPETDPDIRPRMRSISGCRATAFGRLDSDDMDLPCDEDAPKHRTSHR
uniref:PEHE domain-containing protein n=1 Tax=Periophthalmus magnuspinnatus TaxID=409849 RepID=A0A3B4ABU8_9GOBI